jgi:O-antigen/teichoic acid export membrane protein
MSAATPFAILCFASAFSYINSVFGFACVSVNKHHKLIYASVGSLILNIILNLILIPRYSIVGAAWATVITEILASVVIYIIFIKETRVKIVLIKYIYKPLIAALITLIVCGFIKILWETRSALLNTFIASGLVLVVYAGLLMILRGYPIEISQGITLRLRSIIKR